MRTGASHLKRHNIARLCTNHGCVDVTEGVGGAQVIGGHQLSERGMKQIISGMRAASYHPTLPPEIATDAAVYVAVIVVFYAAIIILLVGTNLHRLRRRRRNRPSHHRHPRPVDTTASAEVSMSMMSIFSSSSSSSSAENPGPVSTSVVTEKGRWGEHEDAVVV
ncbi:uncharacterized protein [Macrobrachium rosenbergii]|uniref:uncharacterized protein n=1 Tax=Macrobrachium rosenbergii TaxID=79674 RepID=UPI0034D7A7C5